MLRFLFVLGVSVSLCAQDAVPTRTAEIEHQVENKSEHLSAPQPGKAQRLIDEFTTQSTLNRVLGRFPGLNLRFGSLVTGSGFALGPEYARPDLRDGTINFRATFIGSVRKYYVGEVYLGFPSLLANRFDLETWIRRTDSPGIEYYGEGARSQFRNRSNFRREETEFDFRAGWRPFRSRILFMGVTGGYALYNVGPGQRDNSPSSDTIFSMRNTPGLDTQVDFWRGGPFMALDTRDMPGDPHSGSRFQFYMLTYHSRETDAFSFRRYRMSGEHYVPFLNKKRVFVIHSNTEFVTRGSNQRVPFYLQSTLGGSDDLRGYPPFRFYDIHRLVANVEYRWEVAHGIDAVAFADAGKIMHTRNDLDLHGVLTSFGGGFRVKTRDRVFMRFDIGASREGVQAWLKFNNMFSRFIFF